MILMMLGSTLDTFYRLHTLHDNGWIVMMVTLQLSLSDPRCDDDHDHDDGNLATGATNL